MYFWESDHIRLRPLEEADAGPLLASDRDSAGRRKLNHGVGLPRSLEGQIETLPAGFRLEPERLDFAMVTLDAEDLAGWVAITDINEGSGSFSTMSWVLPDFRGRGYVLESKLLMLRYMFGERRFQKYNTRCMEGNAPIISHFETLGCQLEGRIRRNIFTAGRYFDELCYGMTVEEFNSRWGGQAPEGG